MGARKRLRPDAEDAGYVNLYILLRDLALFKDCPDDFVRTLAAAAKTRTMPAGSEIVQAGRMAEVFFVLCSGKAEVRLDGERVAILDEPGDLIGEMSALAGRTAVALVVAIEEVQLVEISARQLDMGGRDAGEFGYYLYRALSTALSNKIAETNVKARQFEIANRALVAAGQQLEDANRNLEQKVKDRTVEVESRNAELIASHRKLEELYATKDITFKRLDELQLSILTPLQETIGRLEPMVPDSEKENVEKARRQVRHAIDMLQPFSQLYSTEQAIRNKRVLLAESDRKQQTVSKMALRGSGVRLDVAASIEEGLARLSSGVRYDMVFVSSTLADLIPQIHQHSPGAKVVFMSTCNVPAELPALRQHSSLISSIVSRHPADRTFTVKNVGTTVAKLVSKNIFGMEKYLIWGVEVHSLPIVRSDERKSLIEQMRSDFVELGVRGTICERIGCVAEELLMNAIYDAPVSKTGEALYNHADRGTLIELKKNEQGEFRYGCDGMLAAVSVADPFGGFKMRTLLDYLEKNFSGSADPQLVNKGGAGRGLHQIIVQSDLVVFNVHRDHRTEAIALFNLDPQMVVEDAKPSFHFFLE